MFLVKLYDKCNIIGSDYENVKYEFKMIIFSLTFKKVNAQYFFYNYDDIFY